MHGAPNTIAITRLAVNTAASGAASIITLAASTDGSQHVIDFVDGSYAAAPTGGVLTITGCASSTNTSLTWSVDITSAGAFHFTFPPSGLRGVVDTAMVITLADGSQAKDLNVGYR